MWVNIKEQSITTIQLENIITSFVNFQNPVFKPFYNLFTSIFSVLEKKYYFLDIKGLDTLHLLMFVLPYEVLISILKLLPT